MWSGLTSGRLCAGLMTQSRQTKIETTSADGQDQTDYRGQQMDTKADMHCLVEVGNAWNEWK